MSLERRKGKLSDERGTSPCPNSTTESTREVRPGRKAHVSFASTLALDNIPARASRRNTRGDESANPLSTSSCSPRQAMMMDVATFLSMPTLSQLLIGPQIVVRRVVKPDPLIDTNAAALRRSVSRTCSHRRA